MGHWIPKFPKLGSNSEFVPSVKPGCYAPQLYNDFISLSDDSNLVQIITQPTRGENILDLFLTSNQFGKQNIVKPDISDHDLEFSEVLTKPAETWESTQFFLFIQKSRLGGL